MESGKLAGVDFLIGREEDIAKLTRNMAGFGMGKVRGLQPRRTQPDYHLQQNRSIV